jgi:hypothetical protein
MEGKERKKGYYLGRERKGEERERKEGENVA